MTHVPTWVLESLAQPGRHRFRNLLRLRWIEIWEQGYDCTGESAPDHVAWRGLASSYEDACQKLLKERLKDPKRWGPASYHRIENGRHAWWGCGWYEKVN